MAGLSDIHVIETLDGYGFTDRRATPWRGEDPGEWDAYPIEISELPDFSREPPERDELDVAAGPSSSWEQVADEIGRGSSNRNRVPRSTPVEALAWYLPFHYYGPDWGIYIKEREVITIATAINVRLGGGKPSTLIARQLIRAAFSVLYLHEAFHHKVESFATRLEISRRSRVYIPYDEAVFRPLLGTDDLLEEAFACAEMYTRFKDEKSFHGNVQATIKAETLNLLEDWIPTLPPGYRRGIAVTRQDHLLGTLQSQVAEAHISPSQPAEDWAIANQMIRGLFHKNSVAHVIVPKGHVPKIPWLGAERYLSLSSRKVERHITHDFGYHDTGRGKGSHRHFHCQGRDPITLPTNRESLSPGVQRQVARALGYRNIRELAAHC